MHNRSIFVETSVWNEMGAETELKLRISAADARKLARLGVLRGIKPDSQLLENVYYDTADHSLAEQRIALRHRRIGDTWLITVKTAEVSTGGLSTRPEWEYPCAPGELDFSGVDLKSLRQKLDKLRPRLLPLFATNFRRRTWLYAPHKDLTIELALDQGEILARPPGCPAETTLKRPICELELELKKGSPTGLFELAITLAEKLSLLPENESKAQRGQRLFRGLADAPKPAGASRLDQKLPAILAFQQLAHDCLNHFLANAEGVRSADSPEYIHQARVALRRLRALLKIFSPLLPPDFLVTYNEGWRHFGNQLGDARDHDVLVEETLPSICRHFEGHDAIERFVAHAQSCRQKARESARAIFNLPTLGQLALRFLADLARLEPRPEDPTLQHFAEQALKRRLKRVRRDATDFDQKKIDELHRLRIQVKRLRYAVDFFSPLYESSEVKPYSAALKAIQELLGRVNDLERALCVESMAPEPVRCELVAGWLSATQQSLIAALPPIADQFTALAAPWEDGHTGKGKKK